jgi:hypothetical protein
LSSTAPFFPKVFNRDLIIEGVCVFACTTEYLLFPNETHFANRKSAKLELRANLVKAIVANAIVANAIAPESELKKATEKRGAKKGSPKVGLPWLSFH